MSTPWKIAVALTAIGFVWACWKAWKHRNDDGPTYPE